jgi:hypothetical protein
MRSHAEEVNRAVGDPEFAKRWREEANALAKDTSAVTDAIAKDLAAAYLACKDAALLALIERIPDWSR